MNSWARGKDPDAVLDFFFDWSKWLQPNEVIELSVYIVEGSASIELFDKSVDGGYAWFWARGGVAGEAVKITNRITTDQGRTDDDTAILRIRSK